MPELPEVETVARDLRPRIVGRHDRRRPLLVGADAARRTRPRPSPTAVAGRRVEAVGRRAKQVVVELSGDAALTIHLKMTGQLFVVPAELPDDPYVRLVLELADGREIRFRDIRKFGKVGLYGRDPGHRRARRPRSAAPRSSPRSGRSRSTRRSRCATSGAGCAAARAGSSRCCSTSRSSPASATSTPTRRCGRRGSTRCGPSATLRPPDERRLYAARPLDPGRGGRAARQLDRRLHGARRRRLDAGAAPGLPADRRAVPALRPADQADRDRGAVDALLLVVPAPAGRRSQGRRPRSCGR